MTLAALRLPAGRFSPIFSNLSLKHRPPFFDFALKRENMERKKIIINVKITITNPSLSF